MTFIRTDSVASRRRLLAIYGVTNLDDILNERGTIQTCAGEWRRDGDVWRFFEHEDWA